MFAILGGLSSNLWKGYNNYIVCHSTKSEQFTVEIVYFCIPFIKFCYLNICFNKHINL